MSEIINDLHSDYQRRITAIHQSLGIPESYERDFKLPLQLETLELSPIGYDHRGQERHLQPYAAEAWLRLFTEAQRDNISIILTSAFRSVENQTLIIQEQLNRGKRIEDILKVLAAPGYSEHHTGRAVDITTNGVPPISESFENSEAFNWMTKRAKEFGFFLSYPRDHPYKIVYEPWHWAWREEQY